MFYEFFILSFSAFFDYILESMIYFFELVLLFILFFLVDIIKNKVKIKDKLMNLSYLYFIKIENN